MDELAQINEKINLLSKNLENLCKKRSEMTKEIDLECSNIQSELTELRKQGEIAFIKAYPVLYVIQGTGNALVNYYANFSQIMACFTSREEAERVLKESNPTQQSSRHIFYYRVKAEATENIPKDLLQNINRPPKFWLGWSP